MNIVNGDETYPATPNNSFYFQTENDILDGFYIDLDETYLFISKHTPEYRLIERPGQDEGIAVIYEDEFDDTEEPFLYIISAVGRIVVKGAEQMCENPDVEPLHLVKEELPEMKGGKEAEFMRLSFMFKDSGQMRQLEIMEEINELLDGRHERAL